MLKILARLRYDVGTITVYEVYMREYVPEISWDDALA
jgi:hypothetical protein